MPDKPKRQSADRRPPVKVFGIKNCDTCRAAVKWLEAHEIPHRFHDVRERVPDEGLLRLWCASPYADKLLNRRSTTWRQLTGKQRAAALGNPAPALREHPTLIKRPVFMLGREVIAVGFFPDDLAKKLSGTTA